MSSLCSLAELYKQSDYITLHVALTPETDHMLNAEAFAQMKDGVRIVNCARGEFVDQNDLQRSGGERQGWRRGSRCFRKRAARRDTRCSGSDTIIATPHIAGSTEEAQEIVGIRIVEQMVEYLKSGVALNAVNMPAMTAKNTAHCVRM